MGFMFEKLDVYKKGRKFVNRILATCKDIPKGHAFLIDQLRRASTSILLNIAEGNGRWHEKDRKNFFAIARGSAFECVTILQLFLDNLLIDNATYNSMLTELDEISRMLTGLIKRKETENR